MDVGIIEGTADVAEEVGMLGTVGILRVLNQVLSKTTDASGV